MTNPNLSGSNKNKPSVIELYRRFADHAGVADANQLAAQIASSPARAQLQAFSRDLEPKSAALSAQLAIALNEANEAVTHRRHGASRRVAAGSRRWRGVAALAAAMAAAVVAWGGYHVSQSTPVTPMANAPAPDRIFASFGEGKIATAADEIFRGEFRSDEIFNASAKSHDG